MEIDSGVLRIYSRDDETIIKKMTITGRNGKCNEDWGSGGYFLFNPLLKYGEKLPYETMRAVFLGSDCPPKNGKYEIELDTNFGTYYYEIGR